MLLKGADMDLEREIAEAEARMEAEMIRKARERVAAMSDAERFRSELLWSDDPCGTFLLTAVAADETPESIYIDNSDLDAPNVAWIFEDRGIPLEWTE